MLLLAPHRTHLVIVQLAFCMEKVVMKFEKKINFPQEINSGNAGKNNIEYALKPFEEDDGHKRPTNY